MANVLVNDETLTEIAEAIRYKNGTETLYNPGEMAKAVRDIPTLTKSFILEMEDGTEIPAVLTDQEVVFTATKNDIRIGKTAATSDGVTMGEKIIPAYQTCQGSKICMPGEQMNITHLTVSDNYDYTKLQIIICLFNTSLMDSTASEMISLDDKVYNVKSSDAVSIVSKNHENKTIELNVVNNFDVPCVIRYFTYKEI